MNKILVMTEEGIKRVMAGLAELPAKFSHELILEVEHQLKLAESDVVKYVAMVKEHLAPHEAKIPAPEKDEGAAQ